MNIKSALRVVFTEGVAMVPNFYISLPLLVLQPCCHSLPMRPCSCLPCGISVGEENPSLYVTEFFLV